MPVVETDLGQQTKLQNLRFGKTIKRGEIPSFGAGYVVSEFFEAELMYGVQKYNFISYGINGVLTSSDPIIISTVSSPDPLYKGHLFSMLIKGTAGNFPYKAEEICTGVASTSASITYVSYNAFSKHVSGSVHTIIASGRVKPFKKIGIFSPYVSVGAGIAHNRASHSGYYFASGLLTDTSKGIKRTNSVALEFGVGTKIRVAENVSLDVAAKYYDYGKHTMAPGIARAIKGYKVVAGAMISMKPRGNSNNKLMSRSQNSNVNISPQILHKPPSIEENLARESIKMEKAIAEGKRSATFAIAKKLLSLGMDEPNVMAATGLSLLDLDELKERQ